MEIKECKSLVLGFFKGLRHLSDGESDSDGMELQEIATSANGSLSDAIGFNDRNDQSRQSQSSQAAGSGSDSRYGFVEEQLDLSTAVEAESRQLYEAIRELNVTKVRRLLDQGASLTCHVDGLTAVHTCVCMSVELCKLKQTQQITSYAESRRRNQLRDIIEVILAAAFKINQKSSILECTDILGATPLDMAILFGDIEMAVLLVKSGAKIDIKTALYIAARCKNPELFVLQFFLGSWADGEDISLLTSMLGYAPIHMAVISDNLDSIKRLLESLGVDELLRRCEQGNTPWHYIASHNRIEIAVHLFNSYTHMYLNVVNNLGYTPVYLSAREGHVAMTSLLLRNGACLSVNGAIPCLKQIAKEFANPEAFFQDVFDAHIYEKGKSVLTKYTVLTDGQGLCQIKVMEELVKYGLSKLLKHPLIESLIYLKWKCLLPVFCIIICTYASFMVVFNAYVITTFNKKYVNGVNSEVSNTSVPTTFEKSSKESCPAEHWVLIALIYITIALMIIQECLRIYLRRLLYFTFAESWFRLSALVLSSAVPMVVGCAPAAPTAWQRHLTCLALLLAWLQAMLLLSRLPGWGYYGLMFMRVALNMIKILTVSVFLVIGFSLCFMVQYQSTEPFDGFIPALTKTIVMMSSEFDYGQLFDKDQYVHLRHGDTMPFVRLLFVIFVIFVSIVLMNLMIGVAVADISELNDIGNVKRLEKQLELLGTFEDLEDIVFNGTTVAPWWYKKLQRIRFHREMRRFIVNSSKKWSVFTSQNNNDVNEMYEQNFPSELHDAIIKKSKKNAKFVNKLEAVYDAVYPCVSNPPATKSSILLMAEAIKAVLREISDVRHNTDELKKDISLISQVIRLHEFRE